MRKDRFLGAIALVTSCATTPKVTPVSLPATLLSRFDTCETGEGSLGIQGDVGEKTIGKIDADWLAKSSDRWTFEVFTPLGQTLLQIRFKQTELEVSGPVSSSLQSLQVDGAGFVVIDGNLLPFKAIEIPCFLKQKWPRAWLTKGAVKEKDVYRVFFSDERRDIQLALREDFQKGRHESCASVSWSYYLGLVKRQADLCQDSRGHGTLVVAQGIHLKWTLGKEGVSDGR